MAPSTVRDPRLRRLALLLLLLFVGAGAEWAIAARLPLVDLVHSIPDDSFFYLRVAQEFWRSGMFSFDGLNPTYGFQPLWQLVVVAIAPLCPDSRVLFHVVVWLCCVLHLLIGAALWSLARACAGKIAGGAAALLWVVNPATLVWCWILKENCLYALLFVLALRSWLRLLRRPQATSAYRLGLLLGLCMLARVNAMIVTGGLLSWHVAAIGQAGGLLARARQALLVAAVAIVVAAPWYLFAAWHFGSAMPTSGTWKMITMRTGIEAAGPGGLNLHWLGLDHLGYSLRQWPNYLSTTLANGYGRFEPWLAAAFALALLALVLRRRSVPVLPDSREGATAPVWWVASGALLLALGSSFVNHTLLTAWIWYGVWYCVLEFAVVPMLSGIAVGVAWRWCRLPVARATAAVLLGVATGLPVFGLWPLRGSYDWSLPAGNLRAQAPRHTQFYEIGLWAGRAIPADARCGLIDPGIVSFFSQRRFVSFDPLMNSLRYLQLDMPGKFAEIDRLGLSYMLGVGAFTEGKFLYGMPPGSYDVVWVPWPDFAFGQGDGWPTHYMVVRPKQTSGPEFLNVDDLPCGILYPNDPARRRMITRDRDRLVAGVVLDADSVRLRVAVPAAGAPLELHVGGAVVASFAPGTVGWRFLDARVWRGQRAQLLLRGGDATAGCTQAELVDLRWRPDR